MSALLFRLRNVPEDEAEDIRELMQKHHIEIYETSAGNWGISMPGIWVQDENDLPRAKELVAQYQKERATDARNAYEENRRQGTAPSLIQTIKQRPLAIAGILLFCLFVLYVMISPFVKLAMNA